MANSDLNLFFKNINKLTSFERKKKIYDLTNDLDIFLLYDFIQEAKLFYLKKIEKRYYSNKRKYSRNSEFEELDSKPKFNSKIDERVNESFKEALTTDSSGNKYDNSINFWFDYFLDECGVDMVGDIIEESTQFLFELNELERRAKKLSKNNEALKSNKNEETLDYSDTIIIEKIIFLEKLGVIDFLKKEIPFNTSTRKLATVISAITGAGVTSIQPMLNPMVKNEIENKNNPLKSKKRVEITVNKLLNIGFKPKN